MNESLKRNLEAGITEKRILPPLASGKLSDDAIISISEACLGYASLSPDSVSTIYQRKCPAGSYVVLNSGKTPVSVTYHQEKGKNGILRSDDFVILFNSATQKSVAFIKSEDQKTNDL